MMIKAITFLIIIIFSSIALCQDSGDVPLGLDEETSWLLRLWTPADIEEFAVTLAGRTGLDWRFKEDLDGWQETSLSNIADNDRTDSQMMRNAAYSLLINWPEGLNGLKQYCGGAGFAYEQKPYGTDLLVIYWRAWSAAWHDLWEDSIDISDLDIQKELVKKFEAKWGSLEKMDSLDVPYKGRVQDYADGVWYMTIGDSDRLGLMATVKKRGGFYGDWDNENCYVQSFLFGKYKEMRGPFPNEMMLFNSPDNGKITLGELVYSFIGPEYIKNKFTRVTWVPNAGWTMGHGANDTYFEGEYPFWDGKSKEWQMLPIKLSYSEYDEYDSHERTMKKLDSMSPKQYGKYFRDKAGPYKRN